MFSKCCPEGRKERQAKPGHAGDRSLLGFAEPSASSAGLKILEGGDERKRERRGLGREPQARPGAGTHGLRNVVFTLSVSSQTSLLFTPVEVEASGFSKEKLKTTYTPLYFYHNFKKKKRIERLKEIASE